MLINSANIYAAQIVAVTGCNNNPIDPTEGEILAMLYVIIYWPPTWHSKASKKRFIHSFIDGGSICGDSINATGSENRQQNKLV